MYFVDFIYDGYRLSDLGCMVGAAVTSNNDSVEMGSVVKLETAINHGSYVSEIINADYPDVYTVTFDIFKKNCGKGYNDVFEDKEITWFMRWLNRKEYHKFVPLYDNPKDFYRIFYRGTFTDCKAINIGGEVYGFTLTFTSNSPFAYLDYPISEFDVTASGETFTIVNPRTGVSESVTGNHFDIYDQSEELGFVYPTKFTIKVTQAGRLVIKNSFDKSNRYTEVNNCVANETLTFDCIHKIITSDKNHTKLYNDFNYVFPRLNNEFKNNLNRIYVSRNSHITIEYYPIRKVGIVS